MTLKGPMLAAGYEDTPIDLMARLKNAAGQDVTQASLSTIVYRVDEYANEADARACRDGSEVLTAQSLTIASVIFNTLQTSAPWDASVDPDGYNLRFTLPATARPTGNKWHRVEMIITPSSGGIPDTANAYPAVWLIETWAMGGS